MCAGPERVRTPPATTHSQREPGPPGCLYPKQSSRALMTTINNASSQLMPTRDRNHGVLACALVCLTLLVLATYYRWEQPQSRSRSPAQAKAAASGVPASQRSPRRRAQANQNRQAPKATPVSSKKRTTATKMRFSGHARDRVMVAEKSAQQVPIS